MPKKLTVLLLLFAFLFSQIGLTRAKHYCGNILAGQKVGLLAHAPSCGMEMGKASCGAKDKSTTEDSCCHDDVEHLKSDTELHKASFVDFVFSPIILSTALLFVWQAIILLSPEQNPLLQAFSHSPPHEFSSLRFLAFLQLFLI